MEFEKTLRMRHSCRAYAEEQLPENTLEKLLEAANSAPIGRKKYDEVHLTVVQNKAFMAELTERFRDAVGDPGVMPFYGAPTLIVVSVKAVDDEVPLVSMANAACVVDHMHLCATDLRLGSVYIYGAMTVLRQFPDLMRKLSLPAGFLPASSMAVGFAKEPEQEPRCFERHFGYSELR